MVFCAYQHIGCIFTWQADPNRSSGVDVHMMIMSTSAASTPAISSASLALWEARPARDSSLPRMRLKASERIFTISEQIYRIFKQI